MSNQFEISKRNAKSNSKSINRKRVLLKKRDITTRKSRIDYLGGINFVDKKLVHKNRPENIHIYNLRRELPESIPADIFENKLVPLLNKDEQRFLLEYYEKKTVKDVSTDFIKAVPAYVLRNRLLKIQAPEMEEYHHSISKEEEKEFLFSFYNKTGKGETYFLSRSVKEPDDVHLMSILNLPKLHISDAEKMWLSALLERCVDIEKENIFFVNMHTDPGHEYFFEHNLDHVPGMMVIEAARQFFVAVSHSYGKVPTSGVEHVLTQLEVNLTDYLWLSYPIRIKLNVEQTTVNDEGQWNSSSGSISFYQEHKKKGHIQVGGLGIPDEILGKIVNKRKVQYAPRFGKIPGLQDTIHLFDMKQKQEMFSGSIMDISTKNFMLEFKNDIDLDNLKDLHFTINLQKKWTASGNCLFRWKRKSVKGWVAGFTIENLDSKNAESIMEITRRLRIARETNDIL